MSLAPRRAVLFDFDGTLVDSDPAHLIAFNEVLKPLGQQLSEEDYVRTVAGRANSAIFQSLFPGMTLEVAERFGREKEDTYLRRADATATMAGAVELLDHLQELGLRIALVTNAPSHVVTDIVPLLGLASYFETVVTIDDVTRPKPDAEPYRLALTRLAIAPDDAVVVEDSPTGLRAGEAAGIDVLYLGNHADFTQYRGRAGSRLIAGLGEIRHLLPAPAP
jgi:HAD superfamily hydrolase (TIGR01509 family)